MQEGISVNQLISTALAEKLSALAKQDYLEQRGARSSPGAFDLALGQVPDAEPDAIYRKLTGQFAVKTEAAPAVSTLARGRFGS